MVPLPAVLRVVKMKSRVGAREEGAEGTEGRRRIYRVGEAGSSARFVSRVG